MTDDARPEVVFAVDPGVKWLGIAGASMADSIPVDPADLAPAVAEAEAYLVEHGATRLLIELGPLYCRPRPGESITAFASRSASTSRNHETMVRLADRLRVMCASHGIAVEKDIPAGTWRRWLGCEPDIADDGTNRGINDRSIRRALAKVLAPEDLALLRTTHERDAVGMLLGWRMRGQAERAAAEAKRDEKRAAARKPRAPRPKMSAEERAKRLAASKERARTKAPDPDILARVVAALAEHGRPLPPGMVARRACMTDSALHAELPRLLNAGALVRVVDPYRPGRGRGGKGHPLGLPQWAHVTMTNPDRADTAPMT